VSAPLLATGEAAQLLGVSPNRVRQLVESGQLPGGKIGRDWLIRRADLERYLGLPPGVKGRPRDGEAPPGHAPLSPPPKAPHSLLLSPAHQS
jgi:excisionase family DNA binding protein